MISKANAGFIILAIGLLCSVTGMLTFTGIASLGIPSIVMYFGFLATVVGLTVLYVDLIEKERSLIEPEGECDGSEIIAEQPQEDN